MEGAWLCSCRPTPSVARGFEKASPSESPSSGEGSRALSACSRARSPTNGSTVTRRASGLPTDRIVLDSWAWWEVLHDSPAGRRISRNYLESPGVLALTVDLALAEVSAKLARIGRLDLIPRSIETMEAMSEVLPITQEIAEATGPLQLHLRGRDPHASLADAVMLAAARSAGATLVSEDACYRGETDVVRS